MGRQSYLQKLAFGRSAFQPPDPQTEASGSRQRSNDAEWKEDDKSEAYVQQYDAGGHPIHPGSSDLKRRLVHAQNDVLTTVGVCAKINNPEKPRLPGGLDRAKLAQIYEENREGGILSSVNYIVLVLSAPWLAVPRQCLQTFPSLLHLPLWTIIKSEWETRRPLRFLFSGAVANNICYFLLISTSETVDALETWYPRPFARIGETFHFAGRFRSTLKGVMSISVDTILAVLLAPLEIYAVLQRLGIQGAWPLLPSRVVYRSVLRELVGISRKPTHNSGGTMTLALFITHCWIQPPLLSIIYKYVYTMLPRADRPDKYSKATGRHFYFDNLSVMNHGNIEALDVVDILEDDIQALGRRWQRLRDNVENVFKSIRSWVTNSSSNSMLGRVEAPDTPSRAASTVGELPDDLRQAMGSVIPADEGLTPPPNVLGQRTELQDLLDPMPGEGAPLRPPLQRPNSHLSSPLAIQSQVEMSATDAGIQMPATAPIRRGDQEVPQSQRVEDVETPADPPLWSGTTSRSSTPSPPIGISTSTNNDGLAHLEVSIPVEMSESRTNRGFHPPSETSSTTSYASFESRSEAKSHHRVTLLSHFAADSMTLVLTTHLTHLLLLPLEARFVRSVALNFGSAKVLDPTSRGIVNFSRNEIYSPTTWFGLGLRAGGWRGVGRYAGKMFLVWGIQVAVGFAFWQIGAAYSWWRGLSRYKWGAEQKLRSGRTE